MRNAADGRSGIVERSNPRPGIPRRLWWLVAVVLVSCGGGTGAAEVPDPLAASVPAASDTSGPLVSFDVGTAVLEATIAGNPTGEELFLAQAAFLRRNQFPERLSFSLPEENGTVTVYAARAMTTERLGELADRLAQEAWVERVTPLPRP